MKRSTKKASENKLLSLTLSAALIMGILVGCDSNSNVPAVDNKDSLSDISSSADTIAANQDNEPDDLFDATHDPVTITFSSGSSRGATYSVADATVNLWNKRIDYISASNKESERIKDNLPLIREGNSQVAIVSADDCFQCVNGLGEYEDDAYSDLKVIAGLWLNYNQVVVNKQSGISNLADIFGKKFVVGREGSAVNNECRRHLDAVGLKYDDFDCQQIAAPDAEEDIWSGKTDGTWWTATAPILSIELAYYNNCELLNISSNVVDTLKEKYPWYVACTIPAYTYPEQYQDVETSGIKMLLICRGDLDERLVYDLTRTFWENIGQLNSSLAGKSDYLDGLTAMDAVKDIADLPLHSGAERYYRECGALA